MASHQIADAGHPDMDYSEHQRTYALFLGMMKWGTILTIITLVLMAIFLL